ncbi:hypothetical protein [Paenibacillus ginsengihumi]|uniref:hypothetical protein n=1 Tax=Paenibacillus ginsengihumi TaxID=431596 RepID=UPI00036396D7|nr:hypothetical protein [Paenibacillus ginsengihumi]
MASAGQHGDDQQEATGERKTLPSVQRSNPHLALKKFMIMILIFEVYYGINCAA